MEILQTAAIVLQTHALREADVILVLLTKERGRLSAIARSAKQSKKRFMGGIDIFDCGEVRLAEPKKNDQPYILNEIERREQWQSLRENLDKFSSACFCLELTLRFAHDHEPESAELFMPLYRSLKAIHSAETREHALAVAVYYNLCVLKISGYNFLEDSSRAAAGTPLANWLHQMESAKAPIIPFDAILLKSGFQSLVVFTQEILGQELRAAKELV